MFERILSVSGKEDLGSKARASEGGGDGVGKGAIAADRARRLATLALAAALSIFVCLLPSAARAGDGAADRGGAASGSWGPAGGASGNASGAVSGGKAAADDGKLDVTDLEKKYWASKDTDFSVVQNRAYAKTGRLGLTAEYGYYVNDTYSDVAAYRLGLNYYFSERYGIELNYQSLNSANSKSTDAFINQYGGVYPNHDVQTSYYGVSFNWIPIYAKMSLLNSRIIYFDMAFSPGLGTTSYNQQMLSGSAAQSSLTYSFDISQHFFLTKYFALRFDFQNRWFNEDVRDYRTGGDVGSDLNHTSELLFGFQFFY
jgi:outer membrane beta-barrel protein